MIDHIAYGVKFLCFIIGIYKVYKLDILGGSVFLLVPFFMTGVELVTPHDNPWAFLLSNSSGADDYQKALIGGMLLTMLPFGLYMIVAKHFEELAKTREPNRSRES